MKRNANEVKKLFPRVHHIIVESTSVVVESSGSTGCSMSKSKDEAMYEKAILLIKFHIDDEGRAL